MKNAKLAARYAKALFDLALENQKDEVVHKNLFDVDATITKSRELSVVINSPVINDDKKIAVINAVFTGNIDDLTIKFLILIVKKNRELFIREITEAYNELFLAHHNITKVTVSSAIALNDELKNRIIKLVEKDTNSTVELHEEINADLIGGIVLAYDNKQFDASIQNRLKELRNDYNINQYVGKY